VHTEDQEQTVYSERGSMAREPLSKEVDRMFRCLGEDILFTAKMEYLGHQVEELAGGTRIEWVENRAWDVNCPNDPFHRIELVEE
jgi:hypothetical protein